MNRNRVHIQGCGSEWDSRDTYGYLNLEAADMVVYKVDGVPTLERSFTYVIAVAQPHSKESESSLRTPCGLLSFAE